MDTLYMWTVYERPSDFPNNFVARLFKIGRGASLPTDTVMISASLEKIREQMQLRGLTCLPRAPEDDPKIVEVWL
jgi:hypothetical protein